MHMRVNDNIIIYFYLKPTYFVLRSNIKYWALAMHKEVHVNYCIELLKQRCKVDITISVVK